MSSSHVPDSGEPLDFSLANSLNDELDFLSDGQISTDFILGTDAGPEDWLMTADTSTFDSGIAGKHEPSVEIHQQSSLQDAPQQPSSGPAWWANDSFIIPTNPENLLGEAPAATLLPRPSTATQPAASAPSTKSAPRFSKESVRILKKWLSDNGNHPYANEPEKRMLEQQTGLNRTQIANWLANARRRGKVPSSRASSSKPIDVPQRPATPAISSRKDPLQRWVDSPPEHEPASASAIARAVASTSGLAPRSENLNNLDLSREGSEKSSYHNSDATSVDSSCSSGGSFASATSNISRESMGALRPFSRPRSRRRRRGLKSNDWRTSLDTPRKTYQCTFCTETFSAKHDWQRHERALHLPLERWVCAPDGPLITSRDDGDVLCSFCGQDDPDDAHIQSHNYKICQERTLNWRTFNRKDHLNQHLRLVHNVKFSEHLMKKWKVPMPQIKSQCGFCESPLETWDDRVQHLSDHFKFGKTMADWKGGWGFEPHIEELVENSIPPYFIETERNSPFPFEGSRALAETPRSAYELIKLELAYFMQRHFNSHGIMPTLNEMQLEACRIVLSSEAAYQQDSSSSSSWLQDLIFSDESTIQKAKFGPPRLATESRLFSIKITGVNSLFEGCSFEAQLHDFAQSQQILDLAITESALKEEACYIVGRMEEVSKTPSDFIATWLVKLIHSSKEWLLGFCARANINLSDDSQHTEHNSNANATIQDYTNLEQEMVKYTSMQREMGIEPTDEDLRRQARIIVYQSDTIFGETAADDGYWLYSFKRRHSPATSPSGPLGLSFEAQDSSSMPAALSLYPLSANPTNDDLGRIATSTGKEDDHSILEAQSVVIKAGSFFLSDPNFYRWITEELARWVRGTMSPHNPNCHVPTDAEIQHYARWITYNDGDPLNQTIAENEHWLKSFKAEMEIPEN